MIDSKEIVFGMCEFYADEIYVCFNLLFECAKRILRLSASSGERYKTLKMN